jgi:hypothetical protein
VLAISWSFTVDSSDAGTTCTTADETTLTPTVECDDDASLTATLTVDDGVNAPVVDSTGVSIENAAPVPGTVSATPNPAGAGDPVTVTVPFTDAGANDTHTATVDWGDTSSSPGSVSEAAGSGSASATHAYAASGSFDVTVTVTDDDGDSTTTSVTVVVNGAPTADAGGPYTGDEGEAIALAGTASDPNGDPLSSSWAFSIVTADPGTVCTPAGDTTLTPTLTCTDDATVDAVLSVDDGMNPPVTSSTTVTVGNAAPAIDVITVPETPTEVGSSVSVSATFDDVGTNDTHTATIEWDDSTSSAATVTEGGGSGTVAASHTFTGAGTYHVTVTVDDDDGGSDSLVAQAYVVIYDPSAGFVTGGGFTNSPSGSFTPDDPGDADVTGWAAFGFVSKYFHWWDEPVGATAFWFHAGGLRFTSWDYDWLVVDGDEAVYQGTGRVNGHSGYSFVVSMVDGGHHASDAFRIRIWDTATGDVIYDTQPGDPTDARADVPISRGCIRIHG